MKIDVEGLEEAGVKIRYRTGKYDEITRLLRTLSAMSEDFDVIYTSKTSGVKRVVKGRGLWTKKELES